jgi:hypothetical protein
MAAQDELWIPLVDEPIGSVVADLQAEDPEIARLVAGPRRTLAFKTFAYVKVGLLLGELLVETDVDTTAEATWVEQLLREPQTHDRVRALLREVAEQVAADDAGGEDEVGPDEGARARVLDFVRTKLGRS